MGNNGLAARRHTRPFQYDICWRHSSVVRTLVFCRRIFRALRPIYGW